MITTLKTLMDRSRPLHVIPTRRTGWRVFPMAGLLVATAVGAALLAAALSGHNAAQASNPAAAFAASTAVGVIGSAGSGSIRGAMDHSTLNNPDLLPEPNAALLHSDPNDYVPLRSAAGTVR